MKIDQAHIISGQHELGRMLRMLCRSYFFKTLLDENMCVSLKQIRDIR